MPHCGRDLAQSRNPGVLESAVLAASGKTAASRAKAARGRRIFLLRRNIRPFRSELPLYSNLFILRRNPQSTRTRGAAVPEAVRARRYGRVSQALGDRFPHPRRIFAGDEVLALGLEQGGDRLHARRDLRLCLLSG